MHITSSSDVVAATRRFSRPGAWRRRVRALSAAFVITAGSALPSFAQSYLTHYPVSNGPVGLALDAVGGATFLYVADENLGNVLKINVSTGATVATFGSGSQGSQAGQFGRPYGVAVDPVSHDLYVTERLNGRVQRINSTTGASVFMWGINDAGFNSAGQNVNPPNPTSPQGHFQEPVGIAADGAGNVYVVDHGNNRVQKFLVHQVNGTWAADPVAMWGATGSGTGQFDHPYGAALDASGNLWVADGLNGRVQKFSSSGAYLGTLGSKGTGPGQFVLATWVSVDPSGTIYVSSTNSDPQATGAADINNQWISKFTASGDSGTFVSRFGGTYGSNAGEFRLPFDVVVDAANRAYVSDYYNTRVQVFDLTAAPSTGGTGGTGGSGGTTDTTPPAVSSFAVSGSTATTVSYAITFSEAVVGVDASDFAVTTTGGATASVSAATGSGSSYAVTVTFSGTGSFQLSLKMAGTGIADSTGNVFVAGANAPAFTIGSSGGTGGTGAGGSGSAVVKVASVSVPANGTYRAGDALMIKVRFTGPVTVKPGSSGDKNDSDDEGSPYIAWNAANAADSGLAKYVSGSGTTELTFKYQVHGNDDAPHGITLAPAISLPPGATIQDAAGRTLGASELALTWSQNPLAGVVLVRANVSNHGAEQRAGTPANAAPGGNSNQTPPGQEKKNAKLVNLSARVRIKDGDASRAVALGFVVSGSGTQPVLIRAVGPGLRAFGITDAVTEVTLTIRNSAGVLIATNSGWNNDANISAVGGQVGAFGLAAGSRDAALVLTLAPGAYTAVVGGPGANGVALIEVYDANGGSLGSVQQLANISTRGFVDSGANLIVGFVASGSAPKRVLVRAIGPSLGAFGVSGVLPDPILEVRDSSGALLARNDDWSSDASTITGAAISAGAFALSGGSKDSALVVTLNPGAYSAVVTAAGQGSGAVLVEVYELPSP